MRSCKDNAADAPEDSSDDGCVPENASNAGSFGSVLRIRPLLSSLLQSMAKEVLFGCLVGQLEGFVGAWSTVLADSRVSKLCIANKLLSRDLRVALKSCYGCDLETLLIAALFAELEGFCRSGIDGIWNRKSSADRGESVVFGRRGYRRIGDVSILLR